MFCKNIQIINLQQISIFATCNLYCYLQLFLVLVTAPKTSMWSTNEGFLLPPLLTFKEPPMGPQKASCWLALQGTWKMSRPMPIIKHFKGLLWGNIVSFKKCLRIFCNWHTLIFIKNTVQVRKRIKEKIWNYPPLLSMVSTFLPIPTHAQRSTERSLHTWDYLLLFFKRKGRRVYKAWKISKTWFGG